MSQNVVQTNPKEIRLENPLQNSFINPLPRAVYRPNSHLMLDGQWRFSLDLDDCGLREAWHVHHDYSDIAIWPGAVEDHMAKAKDHVASTPSPDKVIAWYERDFSMPPVDVKPLHSLYQITFGACGFETMVWLNGQLLTTIEGEDVHYGEYTSFSYELTDELLLPVNRLTVRITDTMDADIPRGKQESHVYKRGGIWYQAYSGPVRSVWIETVERNRLRSRVAVVSEVEDSLVRFNFTTLIHDPGKYVLRVSIHEKNANGQEPLATSDFPLLLEAGQKQQRVVVELPNSQSWSPDNPHLYLLVAKLIDKDNYASEIQTHFGLRKIETRGSSICLNDNKIYLDGILYQPGRATYEQTMLHMYAMKSLGCNLVRIHIAGVDPRIYNLADEIGLLLWVEVPSPHSSNAKSRANHRAELYRMLALIETNPSVIIWSLYNEDWGAQDIATNQETIDYIIDTYHFMRLNHPQFLVVDNDGWHHISYEGRLKSDLMTAHIYTPEIGRWRSLLEKLVQGDLEGVTAFPLVVGDPFFYRRQIPLIISEWGGFGFPEYGGPEESHQRAERIKLFKQELKNRPFAGDIYTQATNIEDERNGLIDANTGELTVPANLLNSRDAEKIV